MDESTKRDLLERYITAYNHFDVEGMLAVLDPDATFENYSGSELTTSAYGIDEFRHLAEHAKGFFSELVQRVISLTKANELKTWGPWTIYGTGVKTAVFLWSSVNKEHGDECRNKNVVPLRACASTLCPTHCWEM
ncbi:nuclear transport factor 2 family protein [Billgrantia montanilacus]|uniref:Nuclear transport factor 2 family protein n=1 Tax=Billgrantia montanilacus TaxID=2282305 RepID=A0A368TQD7_9GAMM|nr:nuclear transport factor 2 family protein [Halomonas montanilacus]RCV86810.1 nuclear transport factor 2 family protein [Halomonas montanilacus]